jgi:hypothetical protein
VNAKFNQKKKCRRVLLESASFFLAGFSITILTAALPYSSLVSYKLAMNQISPRVCAEVPHSLAFLGNCPEVMVREEKRGFPLPVVTTLHSTGNIVNEEDLPSSKYHPAIFLIDTLIWGGVAWLGNHALYRKKIRKKN